MAIQELSVEGFRSLKNVTWRPGSLNLLVGPNGAGKSNLLRLLEFVSNAARGRIAETVRQAGGIVPLLWDHSARSLSWSLQLDPVEKWRDKEHGALKYSVEIEQLGKGSSYQLAHDTLATLHALSGSGKSVGLKFFEHDLAHSVVFDSKQRRLVLPPEGIEGNESLLSQVADPLSYPVVARVKRVIEAWRVHHDVHVERGSAMRIPTTTQHATLVAPDGANLTSVLHTLYTGERDIRNSINEGMRAAFGREFEDIVFQPAAAQQIQLAVQWHSCRQPHAGEDLSDGTLRFLFLLTVFTSPGAAPLIAIDEPETGLHPSMLPIVAEFAAEAAQQTQVVLTSHSPEFLDAFSTLDPVVTVCHRENGETRLFTLGPERLNEWLAKYRLGHLFTSGDLEALADPSAEADSKSIENVRGIPPEDVALDQLHASEERKGSSR
jgi:predicted ATPase